MATIKELFARTQNNAISLLKEDHAKVKEIFDKFDEEQTPEDERRALAEKALVELTIHAEIEEKIFYPAVRAKIDDDDLMNEALEEHHAAKLLIRELVDSNLSGERWDAKFCVLSESVRHHIEEEEGEMLPKAQKEAKLDYEELGVQMMERKQELMGQLSGLPELKRFGAGERQQVRGGGRRRMAARKTKSRRAAGRSRGRAKAKSR